MRYKYRLLDACLKIKMYIDGTYETTLQDILRHVDFVKYRLSDWDNTVHQRNEKFDNIVKMLCLETIELCNTYASKLESPHKLQT